jgi:hypothetical protein
LGSLLMLRTALRQGIPALCAVLLMCALLPDAALARGGYYASAGLRGYGTGLHGPAYGAVAVGLGVGFGYGYYGYPLDDSYDYPYGYGEYAEYGPWAYRGYADGGCALTQRRVRTAYGLRWRTVRLCN